MVKIGATFRKERLTWITELGYSVIKSDLLCL